MQKTAAIGIVEKSELDRSADAEVERQLIFDNKEADLLDTHASQFCEVNLCDDFTEERECSLQHVADFVEPQRNDSQMCSNCAETLQIMWHSAVYIREGSLHAA